MRAFIERHSFALIVLIGCFMIFECTYDRYQKSEAKAYKERASLWAHVLRSEVLEVYECFERDWTDATSGGLSLSGSSYGIGVEDRDGQLFAERKSSYRFKNGLPDKVQKYIDRTR